MRTIEFKPDDIKRLRTESNQLQGVQFLFSDRVGLCALCPRARDSLLRAGFGVQFGGGLLSGFESARSDPVRALFRAVHGPGPR